MLLLAGAGLTARMRLYAADFWNKKPPSEWSAEEIDKLVTDSPWAKEINAQVPSDERGGYPNTGGGYPNDTSYPGGSYPGSGGGYPGSTYPGGMGTPRIGIGGIPGIDIGNRRRGNGGGQPRAAAPRPVIVRWESAPPILDAQKTPLPEAFANHYVIAVSSAPLVTARSSRSGDDDDSKSTRSHEEDIDTLKQYTSLQAKGKALVQPGVAERQVSNGNVFLFGFSKELLPLTPKSGEVVFQTRLGAVRIKASFDSKKMLYRGQFAV